MDRRATKNHVERETEETERLVREAPKVKPPRHDRRRDTVEPDDDPDLDEKDKDLSMNYKVIGGSDHTAKTDDLISVRLKADPSKVVQVTQQTLKDEPSKYEKIKEEQAPAAKPSSKADAAAQKALRDMAKDDPTFSQVLKDFTSPKGTMFQWVRERPDTPLEAKYLHGHPPPEGVKTFGDLQRVLLHKAPTKEEAPAPAKAEPPKAPPPAGAGTVPKAPPIQAPPAAVKPEAAPAAKPEAAPAEKPAKVPKGGKPAKGKPAAPAVPKGPPPGYPQRQVSPEETYATRHTIMTTFPPRVAAELLVLRPPLHPDEVTTLIRDYHTARSIPTPSDKIDELRTKALKFYATDPSRVPPPKTVRNKAGDQVPLTSLPPAEQATAFRQHQIQTVAMSLAAQEAITNSLKDTGAPKVLAENLSKFMLSGRDEAPVDRQKRASAEAKTLFYQGLEEPQTKTAPISDAAVKKILEVTKDPASQKLAVGYFQSQDYQDARERFLDPTSPEHISERQSPDRIATRLSKAADFLRDRSERYPEGSATQDTAMTFRTRVLRNLTALAPDKGPLVQELLDEEDNQHYDKAMTKYAKAQAKFETLQKKAEHEADAEYAKYSAQLKDGGDPDQEPPLSSSDRLAADGIEAPIEPPKPPRYDIQRKKSGELASSAAKLWEDFTSRTASQRRRANERLVIRCLRDPFSTYSDAPAMGQNRQAVYWGVDPYPQGGESYVDWMQPHARDLGSEDFTRLLKAARDWLRQSVLATKIDGIVRDTQLRAALDLAIRTEGYESFLHPTLYNNLLARLAGEPTDETLLTVKATAANQSSAKNVRTMMPQNKKVELTQAQTDHILARWDRMASAMQERHEQMGVPFAAAKEIVNWIDKLADEFETIAYGAESLTIRQASTMKLGEVLQRDADEGYMDTFKNPMQPIQTEADEPYMRAYGDDQSSAVHHGKSDTGRPLAP